MPPAFSERGAIMALYEAFLLLPAKDGRPRRDLTIIGAGLHSYYHLTVEACSLIADARLVFYSGHEKFLREFVSALNPNARCFMDYQIGVFRPELYRTVAEQIVEEAAREPGVVVLELGSAVVTNSVTQLALRAARQRGLSVCIVPGVTSIETVLAEMGYDPTSTGLQVFQAQNLLLQRSQIATSCAALILQPAYYDTCWWLKLPRSKPHRYDRLKDYLLRFYPPDTEMALIQTPGIIRMNEANVFWFQLERLSLLHDYIAPLHTLFIPPPRQPAVDAAFQEETASWERSLANVEVEAGIPVQKEMRYWYQPDLRNVPAPLVEESHRIQERLKKKGVVATGALEKGALEQSD
jgi:uncharacterized protein YabN with tetrapyrrole methylase and pyrophosphatase domain